MTQLRTILILTSIYFITVAFEILLNSSTQSSCPKITLLDHIQSPFTLTTIFDGFLQRLAFLIFFGLLIGLLMIGHYQGIFIIYITLLKFFELIPILIDLINLLFIYQYKIKDINQTNSFIRFILSLNFTLIRLIISLDVIRRKCDCRWKRQILVIFDLSLFILVNVNLSRYVNLNSIRIGRKLILGLLIFKLNDLFYNEIFWTDLIQKNDHIKHRFNFISSRLNMIHLILSIRWIVSSFIFSFFILHTFQSINIDGNGFLKSLTPLLLVCITILYVVRRDTLHNRTTLEQYGFIRFCIGFDLRPIEIPSQTTLNVLPVEKATHQTCIVCYDDKDLSEFDGLVITDCQHSERSVCNICLFQHVQKTFEITFTDDIYCPELQCGVKFNYDTVRTILFLIDDNTLVERYDRYVFHRQLEQMDEFIWCSNPLCHAGQLNDGGKSNNIVTCYNCHEKTCFTHKMKWHEGLICEEYDLGIDPDYKSSRQWIVENSKKCPNCPYQIEKNDGCDHMICIKCRHEFCWSCLADFQPIRQDGNHRHNSTCKHYAPYDGE